MAEVETTTAARRVEIHGRIIRADGRVEELGLPDTVTYNASIGR